jgi:hypothetical protein
LNYVRCTNLSKRKIKKRISVTALKFKLVYADHIQCSVPFKYARGRWHTTWFDDVTVHLLSQQRRTAGNFAGKAITFSGYRMCVIMYAPTGCIAYVYTGET